MDSQLLPPELWHFIFDHLTYFDLRRCAIVCKTFNTLLRDTAYDDELWRHSTLHSAEPDSNVDVKRHPFLSPQRNLVQGRNIHLHEHQIDRGVALMNNPIANDLCTKPGVRTIKLYPSGRQLSNTSGITVSQVMDGFCEIYKRRRPGTTPPALPDEIWVRILRNLEQDDLQICLIVSKNFKTVTERTCQIFTGSTSISLLKVQLHPIFRRIDYTAGHDIDRVDLWEESDDTYQRLKDIASANDPATTPPLSVIGYQYSHGVHVGGFWTYKPFPVSYVRNKDGVTILQVMQGICDYFPAPLPECMRYCDPDWIPDEDEPYTVAEFMRGRHCFWNGNVGMKVDEEGHLVLVLASWDG